VLEKNTSHGNENRTQRQSKTSDTNLNSKAANHQGPLGVATGARLRSTHHPPPELFAKGKDRVPPDRSSFLTRNNKLRNDSDKHICIITIITSTPPLENEIVRPK